MNFFLTVMPGFEDLAKLELQSWLPDLRPDQVRAEHGGINLECALSTGLELNRCLRLPTRILVRVADFGCRDFPKLFKKLSTLAWSDWVPDLKMVDFQVATHGSRVKMKKRIEETCLSARIQYLKKKGLPHSRVIIGPEADFTFYIRFDNDVCFVSLDTSGERLHKRGLRTQSSEAPLRETIAAGLLSLMENVDAGAGTGQIELVDPMMGGGTFLLEAAGRFAKIESRGFSYLENPALLAQAAKAEARLSSAETSSKGPESTPGAIAEATPEATLTLATPSSRYRHLVGYEISAKTCESARKNLAQHLETCGRDVSAVGLETIADDFFKTKALTRPAAGRRWVICNPPYGERLQIEGPLADYYEKLMAQIEKTAAPDLVCLLLPQKVPTKMLKIPQAWRFRRALKFSNGGLPVEAVVYARRLS